jgi:hypothetical protein
VESLGEARTRCTSRYSLRFGGEAWSIVRSNFFVVGCYSVAEFGEDTGALALQRLRQLQKLERKGE